MIGPLAEALDTLPYSLPQNKRERLLLRGLNTLSTHHYKNCPEYARIVAGAWNGTPKVSTLVDVPYLPVAIFKSQRLVSVPDQEVRVRLTSSGTTGRPASNIFLDAHTSSIQQRAVANSLMHVLGRHRLPMLVIDTSAVFDDPAMMSARGAGVLGLMRYGRDHVFALSPDLDPDFEAVERFLDRNKGKPFFMFGFTFMVWVSFYEQFREAGLDLSMGVLIHSGGWKKMSERSVDNATFRNTLADAFRLTRIYNFYGMVEQIGSMFLEGPNGLLYPPNFADVIIRDPATWAPAATGQPGVIQVVSLLPHSYPGHSVLTEDIGLVEVIDPGVEGWMGKGIRVLGRVASSELRGCSDSISVA